VRPKLPSRDEVKPDTPLRLDVAARLAFPDCSMTASGLRREAARGRLVIERIAGKDYTTLANVEKMRETCRVEAKASVCGLSQHGATPRVGSSAAPSTSSETARSSAALALAKEKLRKLREH
jgi:hypothetical protein